VMGELVYTIGITLKSTVSWARLLMASCNWLVTQTS
jgi:hypothetical protein